MNNRQTNNSALNQYRRQIGLYNSKHSLKLNPSAKMNFQLKTVPGVEKILFEEAAPRTYRRIDSKIDSNHYLYVPHRHYTLSTQTSMIVLCTIALIILPSVCEATPVNQYAREWETKQPMVWGTNMDEAACYPITDRVSFTYTKDNDKYVIEVVEDGSNRVEGIVADEKFARQFMTLSSEPCQLADWLTNRGYSAKKMAESIQRSVACPNALSMFGRKNPDHKIQRKENVEAGKSEVKVPASLAEIIARINSILPSPGETKAYEQKQLDAIELVVSRTKESTICLIALKFHGQYVDWLQSFFSIRETIRIIKNIDNLNDLKLALTSIDNPLSSDVARKMAEFIEQHENEVCELEIESSDLRL